MVRTQVDRGVVEAHLARRRPRDGGLEALAVLGGGVVRSTYGGNAGSPVAMVSTPSLIVLPAAQALGSALVSSAVVPGASVAAGASVASELSLGVVAAGGQHEGAGDDRCEGEPLGEDSRHG